MRENFQKEGATITMPFGQPRASRLKEPCGSSMKMSGFNRSVIMSGYENNHPDNERAKQSRHSL